MPFSARTLNTHHFAIGALTFPSYDRADLDARAEDLDRDRLEDYEERRDYFRELREDIQREKEV